MSKILLSKVQKSAIGNGPIRSDISSLIYVTNKIGAVTFFNFL